MSIGRVPAPIPEEEVRSIRTAITLDRDHRICRYHNKGDVVRVVSGPLKGVTGIVTGTEDGPRLMVAVHILQRCITVRVAEEELELVQPYPGRAAHSIAASMRTAAAMAAFCVLLVASAGPGAAQPYVANVKPEHRMKAASETPAGAYVLGPEDIITIQARDVDELNGKAIRIDTNGELNLPLAGRLKAGGLTIQQLEVAITKRLAQYFKAPEVVVSVAEFRSQPVSVMGAVKTPGVLQVQGRKQLVEVLSLAGGLRDDASSMLRITRRPEEGDIPLAGATRDERGYSVAEIDVSSVLNGTEPADNIQIMPHDVISVSRADLVYVIGHVRKPGGFVVGRKDVMTALTALSMAEGTVPVAAPQNSRILRRTSSSEQRVEIPVDLRKILAGKAVDVKLQSDDILVVPDSMAKNAALRTVESAIQITTGLIIWRR